MSFQQKQGIVSIISWLVLLTFFISYLFHSSLAGDLAGEGSFQLWGIVFLLLIGISILAQIIIAIIFAIINAIITKEENPIVDERDKLIELKSDRVAHYLFIAGVLLAMGSVALGMDHSVMFTCLIVAGFLSSLIGEILKIIMYWRY